MSQPIFADDDAVAPPRSNGELVFAAPWESRVFGLAAALRDRGLFDWDEFRVCLIAEIAEAERGSVQLHAQEWSYYACWQAALERLLVQKGLCNPGELEVRERELAARPGGHDHSVDPTRHDP